jgi:hypothetical protein
VEDILYMTTQSWKVVFVQWSCVMLSILVLSSP